jgi:hypothetical protein
MGRIGMMVMTKGDQFFYHLLILPRSDPTDPVFLFVYPVPYSVANQC